MTWMITGEDCIVDAVIIETDRVMMTVHGGGLAGYGVGGV